MTVYMKDYTTDAFYEDGSGEINVNYNLKVNYKPLDYFSLINSFQYELPIYILLFNMVSIILILSVITLWLAILLCARIKVPPSIRYKHLAKVTFTAPAVGVALSAIPAIIVAFGAYQY